MTAYIASAGTNQDTSAPWVVQLVQYRAEFFGSLEKPMGPLVTCVCCVQKS